MKLHQRGDPARGFERTVECSHQAALTKRLEIKSKHSDEDDAFTHKVITSLN